MDNNMFLGFEGQVTALGYEEGRWRDTGESYHIYDTERDVAVKSDYTVGTRRIIVTPDDNEKALPDHIESMRNHFIAEFQWTDDKPVLRAFIEALGEEINELHTALDQVKRMRWLDKAVGKQLDGIGEIVGLSRIIDNAVVLKFFGFVGQTNIGTFGEARIRNNSEPHRVSYILNDSEYRQIIPPKVIKNSSAGTIEDTIASLKYAFKAPLIVIEEVGNAKITVGIGKSLTHNEKAMIKAENLVIKPGGVGIVYIENYDINDYFGFTDQPYALGFEEGKFVDLF